MMISDMVTADVLEQDVEARTPDHELGNNLSVVMDVLYDDLNGSLQAAVQDYLDKKGTCTDRRWEQAV
eukprot:3570781-Amphidinium_carterae.1